MPAAPLCIYPALAAPLLALALDVVSIAYSQSVSASMGNIDGQVRAAWTLLTWDVVQRGPVLGSCPCKAPNVVAAKDPVTSVHCFYCDEPCTHMHIDEALQSLAAQHSAQELLPA